MSCSFHLYFCHPKQGEEGFGSSSLCWIQAKSKSSTRALAGETKTFCLICKEEKSSFTGISAKGEHCSEKGLDFFLVQPRLAGLWCWNCSPPSPSLRPCSVHWVLLGWFSAAALPIRNVPQECKAPIKLFPRGDFQTCLSSNLITLAHFLLSLRSH